MFFEKDFRLADPNILSMNLEEEVKQIKLKKKLSKTKVRITFLLDNWVNNFNRWSLYNMNVLLFNCTTK